jgi:GT2 family glycosyltransferase
LAADNPHRAVFDSVADGKPRPKWSVMIPAYNCSRHLADTLESVLAQDPGPELMQIEVVDDASDDGPDRVVADVAHGRVQLYRQPRNVGAASNFNTCIARARGEIVHLLHGDDWVRPGFYAALERGLGDAEASAAFCRYIGADEKGHWHSLAPLERRSPGIIPDWLDRIGQGQRLQTPCMAVRRSVYEAVGGFDARLDGCEDWEMWVRIAARYPVWYEPEPLAVYRVHSSSLSGGQLRTGRDVRQLRRAVELNRALLPPEREQEISRAAQAAIAGAALRRARRLLDAGDARGMWAQTREAWRTDRSIELAVRTTVLGAHLARRVFRARSANVRKDADGD